VNNEDLKKALCKKMGLSTSLFFEEFEEMTPQERKQIVSICNKCDIKEQCRSAGEEQRDGYGVWGGVFYKKGKIVRSYASKKNAKSS